MAHPARLERATCGFEVRRSIQLSYGCAIFVFNQLAVAANPAPDPVVPIRCPSLSNSTARRRSERPGWEQRKVISRVACPGRSFNVTGSTPENAARAEKVWRSLILFPGKTGFGQPRS